MIHNERLIGGSRWNFCGFFFLSVCVYFYYNKNEIIFCFPKSKTKWTASTSEGVSPLQAYLSH